MEHLIERAVRLHLGDGLARIDKDAEGSLVVVAESGKRFPADLVILAIGVRPETGLARLQVSRSGRVVASLSMRRCERQIRTSGLSATQSKCRMC